MPQEEEGDMEYMHIRNAKCQGIPVPVPRQQARKRGASGPRADRDKGRPRFSPCELAREVIMALMALGCPAPEGWMD